MIIWLKAGRERLDVLLTFKNVMGYLKTESKVAYHSYFGLSNFPFQTSIYLIKSEIFYPERN